MPSLPAFISPAYESRSPNLAADRLINLYPEVVQSTRGKNIAGFFGTPGLRRLYTISGSGGIRGLHTASSSGRIFAVRGNEVHELFQGGTNVLCGVISTTEGEVSLSDNGNQLLIADGAAPHILDLMTNAVSPITDPDFPQTTQAVFLDGYFVFLFPNTGRFGITSLFEGTMVDPLDFATAEGASDNLVALLVDHRELWLFGTHTIEVFYNSGNVDFPFERIQGAFIEYGCGAPFSVANLDNTVFWLGSAARGQHMVFRAVGYQPERISTHAIEFAISGYTAASIAGARAYTYWQEGHPFYVLNFDEATWAYDVATQLWHERAELDSEGMLVRHRAQTHTVGLGLNLVGDAMDGRIYQLDLGYYTDDGAEIVRLRACPHFATDDLQWVFHHRFQLDLEAGVGLDGGTEPGGTPQLHLRWSDDGGHTWSNEVLSDAGKLGQYARRAQWRRLGKSRDRVYEVRQSDPVRTAWINANIQFTLGTS